MISQYELVRRVNVQSETIEKYIKAGLIVPDLEVPISEHRSFKYFDPIRPSEYAKQFGWKLINLQNMKDMFMEMVTTMSMSYSYKPVFILAMLRNMNENGEAKLDEVVADFTDYYAERKECGLKPEKKNVFLPENPLNLQKKKLKN